MNNNIVKFKPQPKLELVHACDCDGVLFYIGKEKYIECYRCGMKSNLPEFFEIKMNDNIVKFKPQPK